MGLLFLLAGRTPGSTGSNQLEISVRDNAFENYLIGFQAGDNINKQFSVFNRTTSQFESQITWSLIGDLPTGISFFGSGSGVLSGTAPSSPLLSKIPFSVRASTPRGTVDQAFDLIIFPKMVDLTGVVASASANDVQILDNNNAILAQAGGNIRRTTDYGNSFSAPTSNAGTDALIKSHFPTSTVGYAVGQNGRIVKTTDGGQNWTAQTSEVTDTLYGIHCANANKCYVVGANGRQLRTSNGGTSWQNAALTGSVAGKTLWAVYMVDENRVVAVGADGIMFYTSDFGGSAFTRTIASRTLYGVYGNGSDTLVAVGESNTIVSIKYTDSFSFTWNTKTDPFPSTDTSFYYDDVQFINSNYVFSVGGCGSMIGSIDKGENWFRIRRSSTCRSDGVVWQALNFLPSNGAPTRGFVVGSRFSGNTWLQNFGLKIE